MVLYHFNWAGTKEELEQFYQNWKMFLDNIDGADFIGKFSPINRRFHYTWFAEFKDFATYEKVAFSEAHDYEKVPSAIFDIYYPEP